MADLVIGGNTYRNIDYVKIKSADGTTVTFLDSKNKSNQQLDASISYTKGLANRLLSTSLNLGTISASAFRVVE